MRQRFLELEKPRLKPYGLKRLVWRIFGIIGHYFFRRFPPKHINRDGLKLLNLGSGSVELSGYVNADFYRLHKVFSSDATSWMLDLTRPFKCQDNYWDGVLIEHTNEHILYSQNWDMLSELFRTMIPGAVIRIVVPDLEKYLSWQELRKVESKMDRYSSLAEAISNLTQNHLHVSVWNFELMRELLVNIGFSEVKKTEFGVSSMKELVDSPNHKWQSLYIEAIKPRLTD